jgi:hypothetical protein
MENSPFLPRAEPTIASRIRVNKDDYWAARDEFNHLSFRANQARLRMESALRNLRDLGCTDLNEAGPAIEGRVRDATDEA